MWPLLRCADLRCAGPVQDLSMWRPWAGSLLEALPILKCYNLHALTIVIITKYIYFCGGPLVVEAPGQLPSLPPALNPALCGSTISATRPVPVADLLTRTHPHRTFLFYPLLHVRLSYVIKLLLLLLLLLLLSLPWTFGISDVLSISVAEIVLWFMPCKNRPTVQCDPLTSLYWHYR